MRRESHRYRGVRRASRGAGWGHRAVYVASAIAAASLVTGFGLAGYWFGTFSHTWSQATATGFESAPYGVKFLSAGATSAGFVMNINYTNVTWNSTSGPCSALNFTGVNELNQSGALNATNLSNANATNSKNLTSTILCLDAIDNANISYLWGNYSGYDPFMGTVNNSTGWDNISMPSNGSFTNPLFNISLANLTGNANLSNTTINITGCNPAILANNSTGAAELSNCPFFAGNNNTTYVPHDGFFAPNGSWISESNYSAPNNSTFWHPNQTGYLASDEVFYASIEFVNTIPNVTYEAVVSFAGATPIPQVFFLNTGTGGNNETVTFVFDMTAAWFTALTNASYGLSDYNATNNSVGGFGSYVFTAIDTFSITVSQCYIDASSQLACPDTLGGTGFP